MPLRRIVRTARAVAAGIGLAGMAACGGGSGSGASGPAPPLVQASANVPTGQAPLTVNFNASGSSDPQGYALTYTWAFGDGTTGTGATVSHVFEDHGQYNARVTVSDGRHAVSAAVPISVSAAPPVLGAMTVNVDVLGVATTVTQASVPAIDRENLPLTYTLLSQPSVGSATIDATTGIITYSVSGYPAESTDQFMVQVANLDASTSGTVAVALNSDPLLPNQWHIQNTGATAFASTLPLAGNDLDVAGAWAAGYSGKGIKVGIVDTGIEAAHEDLAANVDLMHSYNFVNGSGDPSPDPSSVGPDHGTEVAGIIGAVAFNGKGGRGVAYGATLRGYNFLASLSTQTATNEAESFGGASFSSDNDVFNASFETDNYSLPQPDPTEQAILASTSTLRAGLGAAEVRATGNDFQVWESEYEQDPTTAESLCAAASTYGVSCGDTASDPARTSPVPIIVGALDADGTHASYSDTGASLWISAPAGEFGVDSGYVAGLAGTAYLPAIITTARDGCANAPYPPSYATFSAPNGVNALDANGANALAADCQYTATMNGTSAATPMVSAVIALMLQANPKLSVRDIKYILARTARQVDPTFAGVSANGVTFDAGWVRNAAGFTFSNYFGFGAVDAAAAVQMAADYTSYLPAVQASAGSYAYTAPPASDVVPDSGYSIPFTVSESFHTVESATVTLNIAQTPGGPSA
ncbi:MAG: S8 family serine peptidase, partial [Steroidobacteraceae bacterium]